MASIIAVAVMLIGSLGVSNIVLAGIDARRFEFGVLRAVGASRGVLGRLIGAEVLLLALGGCILGTGLGLQGSFTGMRFYRIMAGIELRLVPPIGAIAAGWAMLLGVTMLVVSPLIARVMKARAIELLGATRG